MLNYYHRIITAPAEGVGTPVVFTSAAAVLTYSPTRPVRIVRWGAVISTAVTHASNNFVLRGDYCPLPNAGGTIVTGSTATFGGNTVYNASNAPTGYIDTAGGTATVLNASLGSLTAGVVFWHNVNSQAAQTGGYYPAPDTALIPPGGVDTQLVVFPGASFRIFCVNAMTAGQGFLFLEIEEQAFVSDFNNNAIVVSGYPSTNGTTPTPSWPFQVGLVNAQS